MPCMFNPAEISGQPLQLLDRRYPLPGRAFRKLRYTGASSGTLSLNLTFDTTDTGEPVTNYTGKVLALMDVDPSLPGTDAQSNNARPPYVIFHWGNVHSFKAVVSEPEPAVHLLLLDRRPAAGQGQPVADPVRGVPGVRPAEPDLRHAEPAPGAPGPARRDAGPNLGQVLRRLHPVAADRVRERHHRPAGPAQRLAAVHPADDGVTGSRDRSAPSPRSSRSTGSSCRRDLVLCSSTVCGSPGGCGLPGRAVLRVRRHRLRHRRRQAASPSAATGRRSR